MYMMRSGYDRPSVYVNVCTSKTLMTNEGWVCLLKSKYWLDTGSEAELKKMRLYLCLFVR